MEGGREWLGFSWTSQISPGESEGAVLEISGKCRGGGGHVLVAFRPIHDAFITLVHKCNKRYIISDGIAPCSQKTKAHLLIHLPEQ